jgi:predicted Zn-dependent peptidase
MRALPALLSCALLAPGSLQAQVATFQLPSGLTCRLVETHDQPFVRFDLEVRWDPRSEPQEGIDRVLASLFEAGGAGNDTRAAFQQAMDDLGVGFTFRARRGAFRWIVAADSRNQELVLDRLADAVFRPRFDDALLENQRQTWFKELKEPSAWDLGVASFLWDLGDPGTLAPPVDRVFQEVDLDRVEAFRRRVLRPGDATLAIHGDLSLAQAKELVYQHFALWMPRPGTAPDPGKAPASEPAVFRAVLENREVSELWAGGPPLVGASPALMEVLGLLVEDLPKAVAPGVRRACTVGPGRPLVIKLRAEGAAREVLPGVLQATLSALHTHGFTAADLDRARRRWKAQRAVLPLHPADLLDQLQKGTLDPAFERAVDALDPAAVNAALARLLDPTTLRCLALGADAALVQAAEKAGFGRAVLVRPRS